MGPRKTSCEYQKKYRQDNLNYKERERLRSKENRKKDAVRLKHREQNRERMRRLRAKKREENNALMKGSPSAYQSKAAKTKAINR
jgi:sarcosine oxidase gamma subunit